MIQTQVLKTPFQAVKERKEDEMYNEYKDMVAAGVKVTAAIPALMEKYEFYSLATFYARIRRAELRAEKKLQA